MTLSLCSIIEHYQLLLDILLLSDYMLISDFLGKNI